MSHLRCKGHGHLALDSFVWGVRIQALPAHADCQPKCAWHVEAFTALKIFFAWRNFEAECYANGTYVAWAMVEHIISGGQGGQQRARTCALLSSSCNANWVRRSCATTQVSYSKGAAGS